MTSFLYDQQQYHHAAAGVGISRLALAAGSPTTPIAFTATATKSVRK